MKVQWAIEQVAGLIVQHNAFTPDRDGVDVMRRVNEGNGFTLNETHPDKDGWIIRHEGVTLTDYEFAQAVALAAEWTPKY